MLCKRLLHAVLALTSLFAYSQSGYQHGFLDFGAAGEQTTIYPDYQMIEKKLHERYDTLFGEKEDSNDFIECLMADLHSSMENGSIYSNWKEGEEYVNRIFRSIIPSGADSLNVKILRSAEVNAMMDGTGQAYITVGFLANALNEAEIAFTLGHEFGHHINMDYYKSYKEMEKNKKHRFISSFFGTGGSIFYLLSTSNTFHNFRDMEREADKTGIGLAKEAGYNLLAEIKVMKRFKMIEENYHKTHTYQPGLYFRTHPPTDERIRFGEEQAALSDTVNASYFKIDEKLFRKIQMQATDECINLLMQQGEYEDCIELCYRQLLFNPDDEFYLFYINEVLRRYILLNPGKADRLFITDRYAPYAKYSSANELPRYIISEKYAKAGNAKWMQTIPFHYEYLVLADQNGLLTKLPENSLTNTDTLEFVSNKDALNYFIYRQEKNRQSSVNWVKGCLAGKLQDIQVNSAEPFLNRYNEFPKNILSLKPNSVFDEIPLVVMRPVYRGDVAKAGQDYHADSLSKICIDYVKSRVGPPFRIFNFKTLNVSEKSVFYNTVQGLMNLTFPILAERTSLRMKMEKDQTTDISLALIAPEIISLLNKYDMQQFIVVDTRFINGMTTIGEVPMDIYTVFNIYYFDFRNNYTTHVMRRHDAVPGDFDYAFEKLYDELLLGLVKNEEKEERK